MFESFNLSEFGKKLQIIRVNNKLTQQNVKELIGISEDTLRRIENGLCIPKYETLEVLSSLYKVDLLSVLQQNRKNNSLHDIYNEIDTLINASCYQTLQIKSKEFIHDLETNSNYQLIKYQELQELKEFLEINMHYHDPQFNEHDKLIIKGKMILEKSNPNFSFETLDDSNFNNLENKILLLIGLLYVKVNNFSESNRILKICLNNLLIEQVETLDSVKLVIKVIFNLSYNYHRLNNYQAALDYSKKGVLFAQERNLSYCTEYLFARKAIAEILLGFNSYHETFKMMISMMKFNGNLALIDTFRKSIFDKYNVDIFNYL